MNRVWRPAKIHWNFTRYARSGVKSQSRFTLRSGFAAGITYPSAMQSNTQPNLRTTDDVAHVWAHELGHQLNLDDRYGSGNGRWLMGQCDGPNSKSGTALSTAEIGTTRAAAHNLTRR